MPTKRQSPNILTNLYTLKRIGTIMLKTNHHSDLNHLVYTTITLYTKAIT
jgi:hypothetical protein